MSECKAVLRMLDGVKGWTDYRCEYTAPHAGIAHANADVGAAWCSDGEARSTLRQKTASSTG